MEIALGWMALFALYVLVIHHARKWADKRRDMEND